jgi:hypothetical protein
MSGHSPELEDALREVRILRERLDSMNRGFEGCCPCCEPVGALNRELHDEVARLQKIVSEYAMERLARFDEENGLV